MHEKRLKELVNCDSASKILSDLICQKGLSMGVIIAGTDYNKVSLKRWHFYFPFFRRSFKLRKKLLLCGLVEQLISLFLKLCYLGPESPFD